MIRGHYITYMILFLLIIFVLSTYNVHPSKSNITVSLKPSKQVLKPNDTLYIDVYIDPDGYGISSGEIDLKYNSTAFKISNISPGDLLGNNPIEGIYIIDESNGTLRYSLARVGETTAPTKPGIFAHITFIPERYFNKRPYNFNLTFVGLADNNFNEVPKRVISVKNTSIIIDKGPYIKISNLLNNTYVHGIITVKLNVSEDVSRVEYYINRHLVSISHNFPYNYIWNTKKYPDGHYILTVVAYDNYNISNSDSLIMYLDNTPPSIMNLTQYPTQPLENKSVTIRLIARDSGSGVRNVTLYYRVNEGSWANIPMTAKDGVWSADIPGEKGDSKVEYYITVYDKVGNSINSSIYKFIVKIPPEFKITYLAIKPSKVIVGKPINITLNIVNKGDLRGTYKIIVKINGSIAIVKNISLTGGEEKTLTFQIIKDKPGTYYLEINGFTRKFKVEKPAEMTLLYITIIITIVIAIISILFIKKK